MHNHLPNEQHPRHIFSVQATFEDDPDSIDDDDSTDDGAIESKCDVRPRSYAAVIDNSFASFMAPFDYSAEDMAAIPQAEQATVLGMICPQEVKISFRIANPTANMRVEFIEGMS